MHGHVSFTSRLDHNLKFFIKDSAPLTASMKGSMILGLTVGIFLLFTMTHYASAIKFVWCDTDVQYPLCGGGVASCRGPNDHPIYSECVPNHDSGSCECRLAQLPCESVIDPDQSYCAKVGRCPGSKCVPSPNTFGTCQCATIGISDGPDKTPFATKPFPGDVQT